MSDVKLTLEPELETPAPGIPTLTLDGVEEEKPVAPEKKEEEQPEVQLTPEEQKVVDDFAEKIDITSSALVMQYGSGAQKKIANFSDTALANVRTKDLGEVGDEIANLVVELKSFDAGEEEKGFLGFFKKQANRLDGMKARYDKAEVNVNKIASSLEGHQVQLMKDIVMLDKLYETNLAYHKELSMYILAGKKKLEDVRANELPALKAKAEQSGAQEDAQAYNDNVGVDGLFNVGIGNFGLLAKPRHSARAVEAHRGLTRSGSLGVGFGVALGAGSSRRASAQASHAGNRGTRDSSAGQEVTTAHTILNAHGVILPLDCAAPSGCALTMWPS